MIPDKSMCYYGILLCIHNKMSQTIYTDTNILNEDCDLSSSVTNDYVKNQLPIFSFPYVITGLVGYWDMATYVTGTASWSGTGTNIRDKSDSGNDLTLTVGNAGSYKSGTTPYISIGTTTYANRPVTLNLNSTGLTFECLVQITNTNLFAPIMYYNIPTTAGMRLSTLPATVPLVTLGTWNGIGNYALNNTLRQNKWYHIIVTIAGGQSSGAGVETWYINGSFVSSSSTNNGSGILPSSVRYNLGFGTDRESGRTGVTTNFAMGRFYNKVLSSSEVTQNYTSILAYGNPYSLGVPDYVTNGLLVYYDFSRSSYIGSGTILTDLSPNNLTATFVNVEGLQYTSTIPQYMTWTAGNSLSTTTIPTNSFPNGITYEILIYPTSFAGGPTILDLITSGGGHNNIYLSGGSIGWQNGVLAGTNFVSLNTWNHIVLSYTSATNVVVYINNVSRFSGSVSAIQPNNTTFVLNNYGTSGNFAMQGRIGFARIYNTPLSSSQVVTNYIDAKGTSNPYALP